MNRSASDRVEISLKHVRIAGEHLERGGMDDQMVFDAVCQRLSSAIEEITALDPELLDTAFGEDWVKIRAMRNALVHNYEFVAPRVVQRTVAEDIPAFIESLSRLKSDLDTA